MLPFTLVSKRSALRDNRRTAPRFAAPCPRRTRLASSENVTSSTQWTRFSTSQWLRTTSSNRAGSGVRLDT